MSLTYDNPTQLLTNYMTGLHDRTNPYMNPQESRALRFALADWRQAVGRRVDLPVGEYTRMCWRHLLLTEYPVKT